jgi:methyl-accepting chemotaxis protein
MAKKPPHQPSGNKQNNRKNTGAPQSFSANPQAPAYMQGSSQPQEPAAPVSQNTFSPPPFPPVMDMPEPEPMTNLRAAAASKPHEAVKRILGAPVADTPRSREALAAWPFWAGLGLTFVWFAVVFFVAMDASASGKFAGFPITSIALGISGVVAPVAFLWMIVAYLQRASDIRAITEPLRRQLQMIVGTGTQAEGRVRRFNDALEKQLELLRQAGDGSYDVLQSAIQVLQEEEKAINSLAERSGKEIQRIAGVVRDNSEVLEDLLHDNRERFNELSGRIANNISTLDQRAGVASDRMGDLIDRLNVLIDQFKNVADEKLTAVADMSDRVGEQEKRTAEAARRMAETLEAARVGANELNKILMTNQDMLDQSGQRLVSRMSEVSERVKEFNENSDEKEQKLADKSRTLSQTLAREIATLEALTNRLEAQISVANEGLGAHTDELEVKQGKLAEQAGSLMQDIQSTIQVLDHNTQTVFEKFSLLRNQVTDQSERVMQQFNSSGDQYNNMADKLETISRTVAERVSTIGRGLDVQMESIARNSERAASASEQASAGVGSAMEQLEIMIGRIFDAEKRAQDSARDVALAYDTSLETLQQKVAAIGGVAHQHLHNLSEKHDEFEGVAVKLAQQARETEGTWQSLVAAAEKQQGALQEQLRVRMDDAVEMLNENAAAIEAARDSLHGHIEAGFCKSQELVDHLAKVGEMTDAPFNDAVRRVKGCVEASEEQLMHFVGVLNKNADQMNEISNTLSVHSERAGYKAAETLAGLDAVASRMEAIQHDNMQATQDILLRLDRLVAQLQSRMGDLSATASEEQKKLAETVKQLSFDINGLIHDSQTADSRVSLAASHLAEQAGELRISLDGQVQAMETITARYNELSTLSNSGMEERMSGLGQAVQQASQTLQCLGGAIDERTHQLSLVQGQLHEGSRALDETTQQALDRLSVFTHALVAAQTTSQDTAQTVYARLKDMEDQFTRQISAVNDGSQTMTQNMRQAVADLVEQSVGLAAASQQAESRITTLASETSALQNQAQIVRMAIETEASAMQNRMGEVLAQIESACVGLERNAVIAFDRTEGMAKRFDKVSDAAFNVLGEAAEQIGAVADTSIAKIGDVNKAITEQVAAITFAGEHLGDIAGEVGQRMEAGTQQLNRLASEVGSIGVHAADQLRQQVKGLAHESEGLLLRFEALGNGLAHQSLGILDIIDGITRSVREVNATLEASQEEAYRIRQQILSETIEFKNEVAAGAQNVAAVGDALQQRGDFAIAMVHQMAQRFTETTQHLKTQFEVQAERVQKVTDAAETNLHRLGETLLGHADTLNATTDKLGNSSQTIGETLEKSNFLLRNLSGQIERMKGISEAISESFVLRLTETLSACESELKGMSANASSSLDDLNAKARTIGATMKEEADMVAEQMLSMMKTMQDEAGSNLLQVAETANTAVDALRTNSADLAEALRRDTEEALTVPAEQLIAFQSQFRDTFVGMAEAVVSNLRQIQDSGAMVVQRIREGAAGGAEQANEVLANLRSAAEQEVRSMTTGVETTMRQMHQIAQRVHQELAMSGEQAQKAALLSLNSLRNEMESDMRALIDRAHGALAELQGNCEGLVNEMATATSEAEKMGAGIGRLAQSVQQDASRVVQSVADVSQNLAATNTQLQRSQSNLFDVAQKSSEALGLFTGTLEDHTRGLGDLQSTYARTAEQMEATDQRLAMLKGGFQNVLGDLLQNLNNNMMQLGQQILAVRAETEDATQSVSQGTEAMAQQKAVIAALTQALGQLESVNRNLSASMREGVEDTVQQVERFERQTDRVRQASESTGQWVTSLSQHMQGQLSQLSREMERTMGQRAASLMQPETRMEPAPAPRVQAEAPRYQPRTESRTESRVETRQEVRVENRTEDPLLKLRDMASRAQQAEMAKPVAKPPVSRTAAGTASDFGSNAASTGLAAKPAAAARSSSKADSDLINSLSQIIQQLEDTAGGTSSDPLKRKTKI